MWFSPSSGLLLSPYPRRSAATTVYFFASSGATRYQDRWVSGAPWIRRSGGPLPPTTVCSEAPLVWTLWALNPGSRRASSAKVSEGVSSAARAGRVQSSIVAAQAASPTRSRFRLLVCDSREPSIGKEVGGRIGLSGCFRYARTASSRKKLRLRARPRPAYAGGSSRKGSRCFAADG